MVVLLSLFCLFAVVFLGFPGSWGFRVRVWFVRRRLGLSPSWRGRRCAVRVVLWGRWVRRVSCVRRRRGRRLSLLVPRPRGLPLGWLPPFRGSFPSPSVRRGFFRG